jgi:shikimate kinase
MRMQTPSTHYRTISLIGMPGAGKSTVGVLLAKLVGLQYTDTDLSIQQREQASLQDVLEREGHVNYRRIEEEVVLAEPLDERSSPPVAA